MFKRFLSGPVVPTAATGDEARQLRLRVATAGVGLAFAAGLAGAGMQAVAPGGGGELTAGAVTAATEAAGEQLPVEQLHPQGIPSGQQSFPLSDEQKANVKAIVETGKKLGLPPRAWVIAVATSAQESKLKNLGHLGDRNDHDSQGLFQQRPSSGWGTVEQIRDPEYSATAFYLGTDSNKGLVDVPGYESMPLTQAAQKVQVSAYPQAYAKWEKLAGELVAEANR